LSTLEAFLGGSGGGLFAYILAFVLPEIQRVLKEEAEGISYLKYTKRRWIAATAMAIVFIAGGGAIAVLFAAKTWRAATFYGITWEVIARGLLNAGAAGAMYQQKLARKPATQPLPTTPQPRRRSGA
jgi:hypothetical protein